MLLSYHGAQTGAIFSLLQNKMTSQVGVVSAQHYDFSSQLRAPAGVFFQVTVFY